MEMMFGPVVVIENGLQREKVVTHKGFLSVRILFSLTDCYENPYPLRAFMKLYRLGGRFPDL